MDCRACEKPIADGEDVEMTVYGQFVNGVFQQSEEESFVHADGVCSDD